MTNMHTYIHTHTHLTALCPGLRVCVCTGRIESWFLARRLFPPIIPQHTSNVMCAEYLHKTEKSPVTTEYNAAAAVPQHSTTVGHYDYAQLPTTNLGRTHTHTDTHA